MNGSLRTETAQSFTLLGLMAGLMGVFMAIGLLAARVLG